MSKIELNKYAVNKLKSLAVEISKLEKEELDQDLITAFMIRKEIYTELLHESNREPF